MAYPRRFLAAAMVASLAFLVSCGSKLDDFALREGSHALTRDQSQSQTPLLPDSASVEEAAKNSATKPAAIKRRSAVSGELRRSPNAKPSIVFGSVGTASGIIGAALASAPVGIRAWVADVNARGGLNGHHVRVIIRDDGGDPGRALSIARHMVEEDRILAFFGLFGATTMDPVVSYMEKQGVPAIGGVGYPRADTSPMVFNPQTGAIKGQLRADIANFVVQSRQRKLAIFVCREADICPKTLEVVREYAPVVGVDVVYEAQVSLAQPDYTAEVISARNAGADVVVATLDIPSVLRLMRSAHRQEWRPLFSGTQAHYDQALIAGGGATVEGYLTFSTVVPYGISPKMKPYINAVHKYVPGGKLGDFGAGIWVAGKLLERIAPSLRESPARRGVLRGLHSLRRETLGGLVPPLTLPKGPHGDVNLCTVPVRVAQGRFIAPKGDTFVCALDSGIRQVPSS